MERKTIKELMDELKQCANNYELKKIIDSLKEDTYYYFVYFDDIRPCCIVRKFKNAMWQNGFPCCSIYDIDNSRTITLLANSPYFIKMGAEEYLTLPNKQALMKTVRAQIMRYSTYPQSKSRTVINYRASMKRIKQLH